jgi:large subunit ribosomal protein L35
MPKLKTSRGAAKRFKVTKTGKVRHKRAYARHMFTSKSPARKRRLRKLATLNQTEAAIIRKLMPYA